MALTLQFQGASAQPFGDETAYQSLKTAAAAMQSKDIVVLYFNGSSGPPSNTFSFWMYSFDFTNQTLLWTLLQQGGVSAQPSSFTTDFPNAIQLQGPINTPLWT